MCKYFSLFFFLFRITQIPRIFVEFGRANASSAKVETTLLDFSHLNMFAQQKILFPKILKVNLKEKKIRLN